MYLLSKIRTGALGFAGLTALLGGASAFRWYENQLQQGSQFPAVVATLISNPRDYVFNQRMRTSFARVQIEVWGYDPVANDAIVEQLAAFLDQFAAYEASGTAAIQAANYIVGDRGMLYPDTQPPQYQRIVDVKFLDNDNV